MLMVGTDFWLPHAWPDDSSRAGWQRASFRSAQRHAKVRRCSVHPCWLLSWNTLFRYPQASRGSALNEDHQPQPKAQDRPMGHDGRVPAGFIWLRRHHLRAVHPISVAVGLFGPRQMLEPVGAHILRHRSWEYVASNAIEKTTDCPKLYPPS